MGIEQGLGKERVIWKEIENLTKRQAKTKGFCVRYKLKNGVKGLHI